MKDKVLTFNNPKLGILNASVSVGGDINFCLIDICRILRLQAKRVVARLAPLNCKKHAIETKGGRQVANFIDIDTANELISTHPTPLNKALIEWINNEVVPELEENIPEENIPKENIPDENQPEEPSDVPIVIVTIAIL